MVVTTLPALTIFVASLYSLDCPGPRPFEEGSASGVAAALSAANRRILSFGERVRAWVHGNRQAHMVAWPGFETENGWLVGAWQIEN